MLGCAVSVGGCPPPEVLYGPDAFPPVVSDVAPRLPGSVAHEAAGLGQLRRVERAVESQAGPPPSVAAQQPHVMWSGTVVCSACVAPLILQVVTLDPSGTPPPPGMLAGGPGRTPIVSAPVTAGSFSLPVPRVDRPVGVELLADADGNGVPSIGERYVLWLEIGSPLRTDADRADIVLDATDRPTGRDARAPGGSPPPR